MTDLTDHEKLEAISRAFDEYSYEVIPEASLLPTHREALELLLHIERIIECDGKKFRRSYLLGESTFTPFNSDWVKENVKYVLPKQEDNESWKDYKKRVFSRY